MPKKLGSDRFVDRLSEVRSVSALWLLVNRFAKAQDFRTVTYHSIDVQSLGAVSYTHLTLPTKRIV